METSYYVRVYRRGLGWRAEVEVTYSNGDVRTIKTTRVYYRQCDAQEEAEAWLWFTRRRMASWSPSLHRPGGVHTRPGVQ